jgi:cell division protein ZapA
MNSESVGTTIHILGKPYLIKCPPAEINALQEAALYLDEKMKKIRDGSSINGMDNIAIIAALNLAHQLFELQQTKEREIKTINERLFELESKLDNAISPQVESFA